MHPFDKFLESQLNSLGVVIDSGLPTNARSNPKTQQNEQRQAGNRFSTIDFRLSAGLQNQHLDIQVPTLFYFIF